MTFGTVDQAIADIKAGKFVIVADDEDRENEGDLICAAQLVTPDMVNFMIRNAGGLVCLALPPERVDQLDLAPMSETNPDEYRTAYTVSVDASARFGVTTGISAQDRATTIRVAVDPATAPADLRHGGHVFPLRAREGGVLQRVGHTEAAVDLARLAGLYPAGVICEILNADGSAARRESLEQFAETRGLKFITVSDELKMNARVQVSQNSAFNNYFIRNLVVRNDGGFLLTAESYYSSSRYQPWDRWGYLSSPWGYSAYSYPYYYSPYSPWYYSPYYWDNNRGTTYHYDYVAILSYDGSGKLQWSNFIPKEQTADDNASFLSYKMVNIGNELLFTYNELFRRSYLLTAVSVTPDGKLGKLPTLRSLDRGYAWMPRFGVQVSARQVVIPCIYRIYICFAKIDF